MGIASWGYGCSNPAYPGVYSTITSQLDWILANSDAQSWQCPNISPNGTNIDHLILILILQLLYFLFQESYVNLL